jgi:2-dehydropantoate 2-reductase
MRILVLGAGATGGYFGGRLLQAGCDVTFLVRPARAERLRAAGLVIESPLGDVRLPVKVVTADQLRPDWDLVLLACKAWDLEDAIATMVPAMGAGTKVLPVLNGMSHLDRLDAAFGAEGVLGGLCQIAAMLTADGTIRHLNQMHVLVFGHRSEAQRGYCERLLTDIAGANIELRRSDVIILEMWEKWVMLATLAACTCLMRATVGEIMAVPTGGRFIARMLDEAQQIAGANGYAARAEVLARIKGMLTERGSGFAASMFRDLEAGDRIEADHIVGDLLRRGAEQGIETPLLQIAYLHLKVYEARRSAVRTSHGQPSPERSEPR